MDIEKNYLSIDGFSPKEIVKEIEEIQRKVIVSINIGDREIDIKADFDNPLSLYKRDGLGINIVWSEAFDRNGVKDSLMVAEVKIQNLFPQSIEEYDNILDEEMYETRIDILNQKEISYILNEANNICSKNGENPGNSKPYRHYAEIYYSMIN